MDPRERFEDPQTALRVAMDGRLARVWTALPATVVSYNPSAQTVEAQVTIQVPQVNPDDSVTQLTIAHLLDVPVCFPRGGGFTLTFPIRAGDECLVVFSTLCLDGWWQLGGVQAAPDPRRHDLSDGVAIFGPRSQPQAALLTTPSTTDVQLRSDDGTTSLDLSPAGNITVTAAGYLIANIAGAATINTTGTTVVNAVDKIKLNSTTGIELSAPPNTIKANGHILG